MFNRIVNMNEKQLVFTYREKHMILYCAQFVAQQSAITTTIINEITN